MLLQITLTLVAIGGNSEARFCSHKITMSLTVIDHKNRLTVLPIYIFLRESILNSTDI